MRILLPKASKGIKFDLLFTIDMNDFDVEMLLPSLYHLVRTKGRRVGTPVDPNFYQEYLHRMVEHPRLGGFSTRGSRNLLDRWVRSSVVKMGRLGRSRTGEQILCLRPTTMLAYKAGLPKDITRLRGVHNFVYTVLLSQERDPVRLDRLFRRALGRGLALDDGQDFDGRYDGHSPIDIEEMLEICFLDGLTPAGVSALLPEIKSFPRLRTQSEYFAKDVLNSLKCYYQQLPASVLTSFMLCLINFHLFVYSMRLMNWVIGVCSGKDNAIRNPDFFLDCTGERGAYCDELARACVERDLESLERYVRSSLRLRTLDRFISVNPRLRAELPERDKATGDYLVALLNLASQVAIQARADQEFEQICTENSLNPGDESDQAELTEAASYLRELRSAADVDSFDRLVQVLFEAQRQYALKNITNWFYSVSGFNRPYGILTGNTRGARRVARYTLSNALLATLVHAALADFGDHTDEQALPAPRLPLRGFLAWLEKRYGILINRPPSLDTSAEAVGAARRNLEAFKVRLRQIGVFQNLSDDFDAQYLQLPAHNYAEVN